MPATIFKNQVIEDSARQRWRVLRYFVEENYVVLTAVGSCPRVQVCDLASLIRQMQAGMVRHVLAVVNGEPNGPNLRDMQRLSLLTLTPTADTPTASVQMEATPGRRTTRDELACRCLFQFQVNRRAKRT